MSATQWGARAAAERGWADWRAHAACRDEDPELFFPVGTSGPAVLQVEQARQVCLRCRVSGPCLAWALASGQEFGVWGGTSEDERQALSQERRKKLLRLA
jgi:WhiB family transcriptional regulator, redox-sensing transcriptional regulator